PFAVCVGLENDAGDRSVRFVFRDGDAPALDFVGDDSPEGARVVRAFASDGARIGLALGDPTAVHEIGFTLMTSARGVMTSFDGAPASFHTLGWLMGTRVRLVFGVAGREPGRPVD